MADPADAPLSYPGDTGCHRVGEGCLWFVAAMIVVTATLVPLARDPGTPFPWVLCSAGWILAVALLLFGFRGVFRREGAVIDRSTGTLLFWSAYLGVRRERRVPLADFDRVHVRTLFWTSRRVTLSRHYEAELRGASRRESLADLPAAGRPEEIRRIAAHLGLPIEVEDLEPGRVPKSEL